MTFITLLAVGRLGRSVEHALAQAYASGRRLSAARWGGPVEIIEVEARKPGKAADAAALEPHFADAHVIACDEHGQGFSSRDIAQRIAALRDQGVRRLIFVVGGPDGLDTSIVRAARERLAFGPQTWPHALARLMLAEQVYRAASILAGQPYHRD